jgi:hypothetical protein
MNGGHLSNTFKDCRYDETRRNNLYRGISRILLDLAKVPLPRIGSWKMDGRGVISLTNRPLLDLPMLWARHELPTNIPRVRCFSRLGTIVLTIFTRLDVYVWRFFHQRPSFLSGPATSPSTQRHTRKMRRHIPTLGSNCTKSPVPEILQPNVA